MSKKPCNIALGRFQPFTKGHLQMLKDGYDKNGYPAVVFMISNKKFDSKHPFSDKLISKEMDIIKQNYKFIADTVPATNANIVAIGQKLDEMGYEPHLWLCGDDREAQFKKQSENPKYREAGKLPDDFTTYTGSGRTEGVSGTAVRNALKANDKETFNKLVPKGVEAMFDELKKEIDTINESMKDINNYINIYEAKHRVDQAQVKDYYVWAVLGETPTGNVSTDIIKQSDCENLYDNGWFDVFNDNNINTACKKIANFFKKNWNKHIEIYSDETDNDWEVWFELDGKKYKASFITYFGDEIV